MSDEFDIYDTGGSKIGTAVLQGSGFESLGIFAGLLLIFPVLLVGYQFAAEYFQIGRAALKGDWERVFGNGNWILVILLAWWLGIGLFVISLFTFWAIIGWIKILGG